MKFRLWSICITLKIIDVLIYIEASKSFPDIEVRAYILSKADGAISTKAQYELTVAFGFFRHKSTHLLTILLLKTQPRIYLTWLNVNKTCKIAPMSCIRFDKYQSKLSRDVGSPMLFSMTSLWDRSLPSWISSLLDIFIFAPSQQAPMSVLETHSLKSKH